MRYVCYINSTRKLVLIGSLVFCHGGCGGLTKTSPTAQPKTRATPSHPIPPTDHQSPFPWCPAPAVLPWPPGVCIWRHNTQPAAWGQQCGLVPQLQAPTWVCESCWKKLSWWVENRGREGGWTLTTPGVVFFFLWAFLRALVFHTRV